MRVLLQRVCEARVEVAGGEEGGAGEVIASIGPGLLALVCAMRSDEDPAVGEAAADFLARKVAAMRIFADTEGKTNLALGDVGGGALVVSQFTLAAEWRRGNRPGYSRAADPAVGERLFDLFAERLGDAGVPVKKGRFGANCRVCLVNDGPHTIWLDSEA